MKALIFLIFPFILFSFDNLELEKTDADFRYELKEKPSKTAQDNWKRFKFKTAIIGITFTSEGPGVKTKNTTTLVVDDYGAKEDRRILETQDITMINKTETSRKHTIMEKEWLTTIDLDKRTGVKIKNMASDLMGSMTDDKAAMFGKEIMKGLKATTTEKGTKVIAGKTCTIFETVTDMLGMKTTVTECRYKDFVMEMSSNTMGVSTHEIVTSFDEGVAIPANAFKVDNGVKVKTVDMGW